MTQDAAVRIGIPEHSVVVVVGGRRDPIAETIDLVPAPAVPWDVDRPEESAERLHAALRIHPAARIAIIRAHPKAIRDVASIARRHGAMTVVLRLPNAPDVGDADGRATAHDVTGPTGLEFVTTPMPSDRRDLEGPFDIIGDPHGCEDELRELLERLGHIRDGVLRPHPDGRIPVLLGDYTDRGPANAGVLALVRAITAIGGLALRGNHDEKLVKWLRGRNVHVAAGLAMTIAELEQKDEAWRLDMADWLASLPTHLMLDGGHLAVAHAGISEELQGRHTSGAESFAMYGKSVDGGKTLDADGFPAAVDWAQDYEGAATVVHGHVVHPEPRIAGRGGTVVAVDTGVVFGGALTAYRWPERTFEQVKAHREWFERRAVAADA